MLPGAVLDHAFYLRKQGLTCRNRSVRRRCRTRLDGRPLWSVVDLWSNRGGLGDLPGAPVTSDGVGVAPAWRASPARGPTYAAVVVGTAPAWVSYAALATAILAALVALASARISYLSYKATGPKIRLLVRYASKDPATARIMITFTVINEGRGEASVLGFHVTSYGSSKPSVAVQDVEEDLPQRIAGHSQQDWSANVLPAMRLYNAGLNDGSISPRSTWPSHVFFSVKLGDGGFVHARRSTFDARGLIADALE